MKIAFLSGARSDYGPVRNILKAISKNNEFELTIIAHGMHLLKSYGNTIEEIKNDSFGNIITIKTMSENDNKSLEFSKTINLVYKHLVENSYTFVFIVGDRLESYGAALGAHFSKTPIIHYGGGHLTSGAVDNIYRYNITNLSKYHFTTSKKAYATLSGLPLIEKDNLFLSGSPSVDGIKKFLKNPISIKKYINSIENEYVLMTFHPVTLVDEPIVEIMKSIVEYLIGKNIDILITYPNNDEKSQDIIEYIETIRCNAGIHVMPHLGSRVYYSAIYDAKFVIGNSSSGLVEVPYFYKTIINIGSRQNGRALDASVINIDANVDEIIKVLIRKISLPLETMSCEELYGDGNSVFKTIDVLTDIKKNLEIVK